MMIIISHLDDHRLEERLKKISSKIDIYLPTIDLSEIHLIEDIWTAVALKFHFPDPLYLNAPAVVDWLSDLTWLSYDRYGILLKNFSDFSRRFSKDLDYFQDLAEEVSSRWSDQHYSNVFGRRAKSFLFWLND